MHPTHPPLIRRCGNVTLFLLVGLTLLLTAFAVAVNLTRLWTVRVELQGATDAACDAAAATLVSDDLLRNDLSRLTSLIATASAEANTFAQLNQVNGQPYYLNPNPTNAADGDIVFGMVDNAQSKQFTAVINVNNPTVTLLPLVNAVRVRGVLSQDRGNAPVLTFGQLLGNGSAAVQTASTVMLDRDVIGFVPLGTPPLLLAPLALFADYTAADSRSWQYQVESRKGQDLFTWNPTTLQFTSGTDGLYEFQAVVPTDASQVSMGNVHLLMIGTSNVTDLSGQLQTGVTAEQLTALGGSFVLGAANNQLAVQANQVGSANPSGDLTTLYNALSQLQQSGQARIWPLQSGYDTAGGNSLVCGFVAARVASVNPVTAGQPLTFTLQPTMLSTATAVTDYTRRGVGGVPVLNPYVCKVRFVE